MTVIRCSWCGQDPLYVRYHDEEWGVPIYEDAKLFEMLILESMQAGLNWFTVLKKREHMRQAFFNFDAQRLAQLSEADIDGLMQNASLIRHRKKIESLKKNALALLTIQQKGSFKDYLWQFTKGQVIDNQWQDLSQVPAVTPAAQAMAKQLKKDGFVFLGPTT